MKKLVIYITSSWLRRKYINELAEFLRGYTNIIEEVISVSEPFLWCQVTDKSFPIDVDEFNIIRNHPLAIKAFHHNMSVMQRADICILIPPSSVDLEAGWFAGNGKLVIILSPGNIDDPVLLYNIAHAIVGDIDSLISILTDYFYQGKYSNVCKLTAKRHNTNIMSKKEKIKELIKKGVNYVYYPYTAAPSFDQLLDQERWHAKTLSEVRDNIASERRCSIEDLDIDSYVFYELSEELSNIRVTEIKALKKPYFGKALDMIHSITQDIYPHLPYEREIGYHKCSVRILTDDHATIWVKWGDKYNCELKDLPILALTTIADTIITEADYAKTNTNNN